MCVCACVCVEDIEVVIVGSGKYGYSLQIFVATVKEQIANLATAWGNR